jgi:glucokinase
VSTVLAVDLGGTKTTAAHVDARGSVRDRFKVPADRTVEDSVGRIAEYVAGAAAVGIVVPGIYTHSTGRAWCPNLWGTNEVPLLDRLRERIPVPVAIDSDRAGYVLGEAWLGVARGLRDVVFVAIGTGIGVGILSDGRVLRGAHGIAGAAGWFALNPDYRKEYAATGCWEAESAGPAIARHYCAPDAGAVVTAARAGDDQARVVLHRAARYTAMGIANLVSLLNPEAVVLGGGVVQGAGDLFLDQIRTGVRQWAQPIAASRCRVELTQLGEDAGLLGAARLALDAALSRAEP